MLPPQRAYPDGAWPSASFEPFRTPPIGLLFAGTIRSTVALTEAEQLMTLP
ncbi:MAG: hypothetical protein ACFCVE_06195 [Phycisphaerae bacterium]